ncbi:MAG TPA: alpha/beta hydrolase [Kamptonema sp.]|nr:alpha/beta hydrolase [Kamptonema sp.]
MPLPTVILPGYFAAASEYSELEKTLCDRGFPTLIVPIRQRDWFPTVGGRSMIPILRLLDRTVKQALQQYNSPQINLIGHSAGGWIARIYLGEKPYTIHGDVAEDVGLWNAFPYVNTLVTLGTPHVSQERWTRKNLDFVKIHYPGAFHPNVHYVCVAGKAVFGNWSLKTWLAYNSYKLTIGTAETWGDGITPVAAAHLEGAENLVLDGVWHSPRSPGKWYGSPDIIPSWAGYLQ